MSARTRVERFSHERFQQHERRDCRRRSGVERSAGAPSRGAREAGSGRPARGIERRRRGGPAGRGEPAKRREPTERGEPAESAGQRRLEPGLSAGPRRMEPVLSAGERRLGANLSASKRPNLPAIARPLASQPGVFPALHAAALWPAVPAALRAGCPKHERPCGGGAFGHLPRQPRHPQVLSGLQHAGVHHARRHYRGQHLLAGDCGPCHGGHIHRRGCALSFQIADGIRAGLRFQ